MGALNRPGPQLGLKGPPVAHEQSPVGQSFGHWFIAFLRDELGPYPGRALLVARMTLAATLTMLLIMTFRLPGAAIAAYYTLLLSREAPNVTLRSALTVLVCYMLGAAYTLLGVLLFIDYPLTHFLWVEVSIFLCFYAIKITTNYVAGAAFAFIITIAVPLWDTPLPTAALVAATLWTAGSVSVGLLCTIVVEYLSAGFAPRDELHTGLSARLDAVTAYLHALAGQEDADSRTAQRVQQLAMVGVSRLRRLASSVSPANDNSERRSTTVSLIGRVVDLAAALGSLPVRLNEDGKARMGQLARRLDALQRHLADAQREVTAASPQPELTGFPVFSELERTTGLLELSLSGHVEAEDAPRAAGPAPAPAGNTSFFVADAFTNREHLLFSLRGCLAAMLCYIVFNAIAWRGLSTSLATCVITALSSIGSSRQKQVLRLTGAAIGGLLFGVGSQVLILPMLDTIAGFAVLFVVITVIAAWIGTSSPRLSYLGQQIALAFYLIHLQEFYPQTNLAIARDRVMGVLLGLVMMWLVFDTLGSKPAALVMRDLFIGNLHLLAQLARPWKDGNMLGLQEIRTLRDRISATFGSVNAQADAVLFELGPTRQPHLHLRDRILDWQPRLRSLFLTEVALLQYRTEVHPSEIASGIVAAQTALDERTSQLLNRLAEAFRPEAAPMRNDLHIHEAYEKLAQAIDTGYGGRPGRRAQGILALTESMARLLDDLAEEAANADHGL